MLSRVRVIRNKKNMEILDVEGCYQMQIIIHLHNNFEYMNVVDDDWILFCLTCKMPVKN